MISACIIAKNEETNIGRCLESIKNAVDEIIVVDTGSIDNTVSIAKQYGAKVFFKEWNNNFSDARNESINLASGDWILVIDCDEVLSADSAYLLKDLQNAQGIDGFGVTIINIIGGVESYTSAHLRFFKNMKNLRYKGIIHEQIGSLEQQQLESLVFLKSDIKIIHYGYEKNVDLESKKCMRNLQLLNLVDEKDRDGMYYLHLGAEYIRLNDNDRATQTFLKGYSITDKSKPYFTQLAQKTVDALFSNEEYEKCLNYCNDTLNSYIDFKSIYFTKSACHAKFGQYQEALRALRIYKSLKENPFKYPVINYETYNDIDNMIYLLENVIKNNL